MAVVAVVVAWVALSALVGLFAHNRGREPATAVIAALVLSPVFGFLLIAALKDKIAERRHAELLAAIRDGPEIARTGRQQTAERLPGEAAPRRSVEPEVVVIAVVVVIILIVGSLSQLGASATSMPSEVQTRW